ncbi:hypothetical protein KZJ38_28420 [Paraburkholderia edwinii]|uniref:Secreted protein n=1 Tax=Paraburkholderia edwinii TaxID=2861782 RepID=A0ABX8V4H4_9BURK|nr:hypothetical protein [Paraburkholderia edwinii]QYD73975.1 hypothetical protein KZJ38_28420 [Paraburkholderia edwinii]
MPYSVTLLCAHAGVAQIAAPAAAISAPVPANRFINVSCLLVAPVIEDKAIPRACAKRMRDLRVKCLGAPWLDASRLHVDERHRDYVNVTGFFWIDKDEKSLKTRATTRHKKCYFRTR